MNRADLAEDEQAGPERPRAGLWSTVQLLFVGAVMFLFGLYVGSDGSADSASDEPRSEQAPMRSFPATATEFRMENMCREAIADRRIRGSVDEAATSALGVLRDVREALRPDRRSARRAAPGKPERSAQGHEARPGEAPAPHRGRGGRGPDHRAGRHGIGNEKQEQARIDLTNPEKRGAAETERRHRLRARADRQDGAQAGGSSGDWPTRSQQTER